MSQTKEIPVLTGGATGAGSPEQATAAAVAADASETERLVKLITAMGYPESEARLSLARCSNNVQKAVQLLVEGADEDDNGESRRRRRCRRSLKKLRPTLLGDPCATDDAIVQLMRQQSTANVLREMIRESSGQVMQLLLAEGDSEAEVAEDHLELKEEEAEEEEESSDGEDISPAASAESSPPSN